MGLIYFFFWCFRLRKCSWTAYHRVQPSSMEHFNIH